MSARSTLSTEPPLLLIDGTFTPALDARRTITINPSTGEPLAEVPDGSPKDVERAVDAADRAFPAWAALTLNERGRCFDRFAELLVEHQEELAQIEALDSGNPVRAMRGDVQQCLPYLDGWPRLAAALTGDVVPVPGGGLHYTEYRPFGVTGRITAFNHPLLFAVTRPLPALITGNTVVMKPSHQTPLVTLRLGQLFAEAFPPGVVNIVTGGVEPGRALVRHPKVKRLAFTGSVETGLAIQRDAADSGRVKQVSLELGGKNAMIVFPDADPDEIADAIIFGMNLTVCQGQSCGSTSRVLLHDRIHDDVVDALSERLAALRVGVASEETTDVGPLVGQAHLDRVRGFIASGDNAGAKRIIGGDHPSDVPHGGFYINPALFADVQPDMQIAQEEIFGPVISALRWNDLDTAIEIANSVSLGLTGSIWTRDIDLALTTARRLDTGYVWINDATRHFFMTPFGGTKDSGVGREESADELLTYLETTATHIRLRSPADSMPRIAELEVPPR